MYSFLGKTFKREVDVYVVMRRGSPLAQARDDRCCFIVLLDKMEERNVVMMSRNLGAKGGRSSSFWKREACTAQQVVISIISNCAGMMFCWTVAVSIRLGYEKYMLPWWLL